MLYSTREKIPESYLDFLSKVPHDKDKKQCELDILRNHGSHVGNSYLEELKKDSITFEQAQKLIASKAKEKFPEMQDEDITYLSYLMTNIHSQGFCSIPDTVLKTFFPSANNNILIPSFYEKYVDGGKKPITKYLITFEEGRVVCQFRTPCFYGTEDEPKCIMRTVNYIFYPDKTIQMSMCNPKDDIEENCKQYFCSLTSMSNENLRQLLAGDYKENDPFHVLSMNCDQEKCEILTRLVNDKGCKPESIKNEDIEKLHVIEKLRKANHDTMARLIHKYIKNTGNSILEISNDMQKQLSTEAQENIRQISEALKERLDKNNMILALEDICNIVLNFFLKIFKSFEWELGKSAVGTKEFDEFCSKLYSEGELPSRGEQSNFTKTYLETKKKIYLEAQIS